MSQKERRAIHRDDTDTRENWESIALSRVAARVEELPAMPAEAEDFGWEAGVLEKLRKRLGSIE